MAKRKIDLSGFLSENNNSQIAKNSDNQIAKNSDSQIAKKSKRNIYKFVGFYLSQESMIKLKEIELLSLKNGEKIDRSDIINKAIDTLYKEISGVIN